MEKMFSGIYPALVTPYKNDGSVDYDGLERLVYCLSKTGISGFYVCGSTGEAFLQRIEERKRIVESVVNANTKKLKIIVQVGAIGTDLSIELSQHAYSCGADAISSVAPFYYKFSETDVVRYYKELAAYSDLPLILYNFPQNSGVCMTYELFKRIMEKCNIAGLKHTSSDFYLMERIRYHYPEITIFNGYDEMLLSGLVAGADGAIGSTFNCLSPLALEIMRLFSQGKIDKAVYYQHKMNDVIEQMIKGGVIQSIKAILEEERIMSNYCRSPFGVLNEQYKVSVLANYFHLKEEFSELF